MLKVVGGIRHSQRKEEKTDERVRYGDFRLSPMQATFLSLFEPEQGSDGKTYRFLSSAVAHGKNQGTVGSCFYRGMFVINAQGDFVLTGKGEDALSYYSNADIDRLPGGKWSSRITWTRRQLAMAERQRAS